MVEWLSFISTLAGGTWVRQVERQTIQRSRVVALDECLLTLVIAPPLSIFCLRNAVLQRQLLADLLTGKGQ